MWNRGTLPSWCKKNSERRSIVLNRMPRGERNDGRTALHIIMVTLGTKVVEIWQPFQTHGLQLVDSDNSIAVLVEVLEHAAYDIVRLLLMLYIILVERM